MATITVTKAKAGANDINFGTGTFVRLKSDGTYWNVRQVSASHIPIIDSGCHYSATSSVGRYVEFALGHAATRIKAVSASITTGLAGKVSTSVTTSISATLASTVKYWWRHPNGIIKNTSNTRITFPAGYYPVGGKIYYSANTIGWSFQRGAGSALTQKWSNRGFSFATGAAALSTGWAKINTYYYVYATTYGGSLAFVGAGTYPTSKYDTGLTGSSWDTNTYVQAVRTANASSSIVDFLTTGNFTYLHEESTGLRFIGRTAYSATNNTPLPINCRAPQTTNQIRVHAKGKATSAGTITTLQIGGDSNCADTDILINTDTSATQWRQIPLWVNVVSSTNNIVYWKRYGTTTPSSIVFVLRGWLDKYC